AGKKKNRLMAGFGLRVNKGNQVYEREGDIKKRGASTHRFQMLHQFKDKEDDYQMGKLTLMKETDLFMEKGRRRKPKAGLKGFSG
ncbi:hypothetical protein NPIL_98091, partial [Nephila pilipes]